MEARIQDYGEMESKDYIPGAEVLEVEEDQEAAEDEGEDCNNTVSPFTYMVHGLEKFPKQG